MEVGFSGEFPPSLILPMGFRWSFAPAHGIIPAGCVDGPVGWKELSRECAGTVFDAAVLLWSACGLRWQRYGPVSDISA
ncbi:MAG TPA: hypothetical protein DCX79_06365 [Planctomycetaceae bacterium]|nr:hypothetical protein [Planctomycetaceae bacterium]